MNKVQRRVYLGLSLRERLPNVFCGREVSVGSKRCAENGRTKR